MQTVLYVPYRCFLLHALHQNTHLLIIPYQLNRNVSHFGRWEMNVVEIHLSPFGWNFGSKKSWLAGFFFFFFWAVVKKLGYCSLLSHRGLGRFLAENGWHGVLAQKIFVKSVNIAAEDQRWQQVSIRRHSCLAMIYECDQKDPAFRFTNGKQQKQCHEYFGGVFES